MGLSNSVRSRRGLVFGNSGENARKRWDGERSDPEINKKTRWRLANPFFRKTIATQGCLNPRHILISDIFQKKTFDFWYFNLDLKPFPLDRLKCLFQYACIASDFPLATMQFVLLPGVTRVFFFSFFSWKSGTRSAFPQYTVTVGKEYTPVIL